MERRLRLASAASTGSAAEAPLPMESEESVVASAAEEVPAWPGAADEEAFLAEGRSRGDFPLPALAAVPEETALRQDLPPLDELVSRIPAGVREALDDLFRAKFTGVKRISTFQ